MLKEKEAEKRGIKKRFQPYSEYPSLSILKIQDSENKIDYSKDSHLERWKRFIDKVEVYTESEKDQNTVERQASDDFFIIPQIF